MKYTNFKEKEFKTIEMVYNEIETLERIIGGYFQKYKIYCDEDRQEITTNILIEINNRIKEKEINSGYIHQIIKSTILLHLRPIVKEIKLETSDEFNPTHYDDSADKEYYYELLDKIIEICPPKHKKYIEFELSSKTKTDIPTDEYLLLWKSKKDIRTMVSMYQYLDILAKNEDLIPQYASKYKITKENLKLFVNNYKKIMLKC